MTTEADQQALRQAIEAAFARVDRESARQVTRELERLVRQVSDPAARARYEGALDALPDMLRHAGSQDDGPRRAEGPARPRKPR